MNNYPYYPNNTGYYVYPIIPNYQHNTPRYKPIQVSGLPNNITNQNKDSFTSKSLNITTPVSTLPEADKDETTKNNNETTKNKDETTKNNNETTKKLINMEYNPMKVVINNERIKVMVDRELKSIKRIFDAETVNKIRSIKKLLKPISDEFIENVNDASKYKNHNTKYYHLDIKIFINLLEYFEIPYDVQDIIALYENPGNQPDNDILQNELFGISTIIQLCVRLDMKYKRRNIVFIQICNCDATVIPSLSGFYEELDDTIVIPLYMGKIQKYKNHLQNIGVCVDLYLEDNEMYDARAIFGIFLNIINSLTEEKSRKYFN